MFPLHLDAVALEIGIDARIRGAGIEALSITKRTKNENFI